MAIAPLPAIDRGKQVMEALADYVERAALKAGDRLPAERELMAALVGRPLDHPRGDPAFPGARRDRDAQGQRHLSAQADLGRHHPHAAVARYGAAARRAAADAGSAPRHRGRGQHGRGAPAHGRRPADDRGKARSRWSASTSPRARPGPEDLAFHLAIYDATHNPLFRQLLEQMREAFERFWDHPFDRQDFARRSFPFHRTLFDAIVAQDAELARDRNAENPRDRRRGHRGNVQMNDGLDLFDDASLIAAHDEGNAFDAVVPPIVQTSLFTFSELRRDARDLSRREGAPDLYARAQPDRAHVRGDAGETRRRRGRDRLCQRHVGDLVGRADLRRAGRPHRRGQAHLSRTRSGCSARCSSACASR